MIKIKAEYTSFTFVLAGNPNVGKSTVFNSLTGLQQHTGNWSGKTVELATGHITLNNKEIIIKDLPGTYSLNGNSPEEQIAKDFIESRNYDYVIIVLDATALERNLLLALQILSVTEKAIVCLNLWDEAKRKKILIDTDELSLQLGAPVVTTCAKKKHSIKELQKLICSATKGEINTYKIEAFEKIKHASNDEEKSTISAEIARDIANKSTIQKGFSYSKKDEILDIILTSKISGPLSLVLIFLLLFWLTAYVANIPGEFISKALFFLKDYAYSALLDIGLNNTLLSIFFDGIYTTVAWVVSVMLPPALIFFPLFALIEDLGYLPRAVFVLDRIFEKFGLSGKTALTMALGFGCNACGVNGCRIIASRKERFVATVTNSFIPCNGRIPILIGIISAFFAPDLHGTVKSLIVASIMIILLALSVTATLLTGLVTNRIKAFEDTSGFYIELTPYRKPQFIKTILLSLKSKVLYVVSRAVAVSIPAGAVLWAISNIKFGGEFIIEYIITFFDGIGKLCGTDGVIVSSYLLSFPANELFFPIALMSYQNSNTLTDYSTLSELHELLTLNGWTLTTAISSLILCIFHFPCSTTCFMIKKETKSNLCLLVAFFLPLCIGIIITASINLISMVF